MEELSLLVKQVLNDFHPDAVTRYSETFSYDRGIEEIEVEFYTEEYKVSLTIRR